MSSKLNVSEIIAGHFKTLRNDSGVLVFADRVVFFLLPFVAGFIFCFFEIRIKESVLSLLVNFGAIFTALLLSVLVLVYDQQGKVSQQSSKSVVIDSKKALLHDLHYNISFSILCSIFLVVACLIASMVGDAKIDFTVSDYSVSILLDKHVLSPIVAFITCVVFVNVVMIVKRMHSLLTS